jgi:hypothetical protein
MKGVDAFARGRRQRFGGTRDIAVVGTRERADGRFTYCSGNRPDGFEVALRGSGKAGLDDVDLEALELARNADLFILGHRRARRLLAIAQGGVKDDQAVRVRHGGSNN